LADILGNFVNRALVLTQKYYEGKVPELGVLTEADQQVLSDLALFPAKIEKLIYAYKLRDAQSEVMNLARLGNKYLAENEPWKLVKTDPKRVETIMHVALQITANLSLLLEPFLPSTAKKLRTCLNIDLPAWSETGKANVLNSGDLVQTPEILFPKIEDSLVEAEIAFLKLSQQNSVVEEKAVAPQKPNVSFDDFSKLDIRLGTILEAEKVPKADKLLKLIVDTGIDIRTIVSGIAEHYSPEEIIGKTVSVLLNLEPRKIRGVESQGMILMAENEKGELSFMFPEKNFTAGGEIR
jgi:methionyl-tRNA synthetase